MQKQSVYPNAQQRMPLLDLTNLQQNTFDNSKFSVQSTKTTFQPITSNPRKYGGFFNTFETTKCSHFYKMEACHGRHYNCTECGAFVSRVNRLL